MKHSAVAPALLNDLHEDDLYDRNTQTDHSVHKYDNKKGAHKFSTNLGATSEFYAPRRVTRSRFHKY